MIVMIAAVLLWILQEPLDADLERLADDRVEVRQAAAARLVERFLSEGPVLRRRAEEAGDPEVRARLKEIIASGELLVDRREFARHLSARARAAYPDLEADLFGGDVERREKAFRIIARSASTFGDQEDPLRWFFLSNGECRKLAPCLPGLIRGGEDLERVRLAWIDLVVQRPLFLDSARARRWSSELFRDASPSVRREAMTKLIRTAAFDAVAPDLLGELDSLDTNLFPVLDQAIAERKLEAGFPYLCRRLREKEITNTIVALILENDVRPMIPEVFRAYAEGVRIDNRQLEWLPRAELRDVVLKKLEGTAENKHQAFSAMAHLRMVDQVDRVAGLLSDPDWSVRSSALAYFQTTGVDASRHAKAVAQCVAEYWAGAREGKDPGYAVDAAANLLTRWNARAEAEGLIPLIWNKASVRESVTMIRTLKPAGAAKKVVEFVDEKDLPLAGPLLALLGDLKAKEEFLSRKDVVLKIVESPARDLWNDSGRSVLFAAAGFGVREVIPVALRWEKDDLRRWNAAWALGDVWSVHEKIEALESGDPWRRYLGAWSIGYKGPQEALDKLWSMIGHADPEVRKAIASSLHQFRPPDGGPRLLQLVDDEDREVVRHAVWCFLDLTCRGKEETYYFLRDYPHSFTLKWPQGKDFITHPHPHLRLAAARGLTPEIARSNPALLEPLLRDSDTGVQRVAWKLYEEAGGRKDPTLFARRVLEWRTDGLDLTWSLRDLAGLVDPEVLGPLVLQFLEQLQDGTKAVRTRTVESTVKYDRSRLIVTACTVLGQCRTYAAEEALLNLIESPDQNFVRAAAEALGAIRSEKAIPTLMDLLTTNQSTPAAAALGEIGVIGPDFLDETQPALGPRIAAVGRARHRDAIDQVVTLIRHRDWSLSNSAESAFDAMARTEDAARILGLAHSPFAHRRARMLKLLRRMEAPELASDVARFLDDAPEVAVEAARALQAQRRTFRADQLPVDLSKVPATVLAALLPVLEQPDADRCLPRILDSLRRPWTDRAGPEIYSTLQILARRGDAKVLSEVVEAIRRLPEDRRYGLGAELARGYGKAAAEYLRSELGGTSDYTRREAARVLASIGDRASRPEIEKLIVDTANGSGNGPDVRALLQGGFDDLAGKLIEKNPDGPSLAVAALHGLPAAKRKVLRLLRADGPTSLIDDLPAAEDPAGHLQWGVADGLERLERGVRLQETGATVRISIAPEVRDLLDLQTLRMSWSEYDTLHSVIAKLSGAPYRRLACYWSSPGVLKVDTLDRVREHWIRRLSR
jgi:HEAT repeat protein